MSFVYGLNLIMVHPWKSLQYLHQDGTVDIGPDEELVVQAFLLI